MADPKLVTPDLTELERLKAAASEVCSHDPRYDGCPKCVAFEAYDEALHAAAGSLIQAARRLGELEAYCASLRERAESERGSAEHRLLVNADLQRQLTTANARIAELEDVLRRIYDMGEPMSAAIAQGVVAPVTVELSAHAPAKGHDDG